MDFKQVFDTIYRHKMIKILQMQGIPNKLIAVRQGDAWSVILFNLVLDYIIQNLDIREIYQLQQYRSMHMHMMWSQYLGISKT